MQDKPEGHVHWKERLYEWFIYCTIIVVMMLVLSGDPGSWPWN